MNKTQKNLTVLVKKIAKKFDVNPLIAIYTKKQFHVNAGSYNLKNNYLILYTKNIALRSKIGFDNLYYYGRDKIINPYILNSYKKTLIFVILHEIGHVIYGTSEFLADFFALKYLKNVILSV